MILRDQKKDSTPLILCQVLNSSSSFSFLLYHCLPFPSTNFCSLRRDPDESLLLHSMQNFAKKQIASGKEVRNDDVDNITMP